jgi:helix-turn-helix, Psq domain/Tc5 transposase DNA-binding domain
MNQRESMLQSALADLESGKYTSIRQAAKAYNIPRSTLADRQHGKPPRSVAHEQQQRLTPAQEEFLTEWILEQDLQGYTPSHTRIREMAARILRMNGDVEPLGDTREPKSAPSSLSRSPTPCCFNHPHLASRVSQGERG